MNHHRLWAVLLATCVLQALPALVWASEESPPSALLPGQWLEVRGHYQSDGQLHARRADLLADSPFPSLLGTASAVDADGHFMLLGRQIQIGPRTRYRLGDHASLAGLRVKVDGRYAGDGRLEARSIRSRKEGLDRVIGQIESIQQVGQFWEVRMLGLTVRMNADLEVEHDLPFEQYPAQAQPVDILVNSQRDEEDLFGKGVWLNDSLLVAGQAQARGTWEDNFDLNSRQNEDRTEALAALRLRMVYQPRPDFFAVAEISHRQLRRDDQRDGRLSDDVTRLGEAYLYWQNPFNNGLDLQLGRVDFDDEREWLFDQNLDTLRGRWIGPAFNFEYSYSETLSDGSTEDEAAGNHFLQISNQDSDRTLAGYLLHRDFDLLVPLRRTYIGLRALGEWFPDQESWLDLAYLNGRSGAFDQRGMALDLGTTWQPGKQFAWTLGYAWGQGDQSGASTGHSYRQSGMQDNNGKFAGVTSFRYYGELLDPELSNIHIGTLGVAWLPSRALSLDLVWHQYRQDALSTRLVDTSLDRRPNGQSKDIGTGLDLVLGWRTPYNLDIEVVAAWFKPGRAFTRLNDAFLGKLQLRYRF